MSDLQKFNFQDVNVRVHIDEDGEPWFVASDVCKALELSSPSKAVERLRDFEKGLHPMMTPGGPQEMIIVNETGLYRMIFRSNKPEAEKFQDWVFGEVLPQIRRTGEYRPHQRPSAGAGVDASPLVGLAGITQQLTDFVGTMQAKNEQRLGELEGRLNELEKTKTDTTRRLNLEALRDRFNGALRASRLSAGMNQAEKTAYWSELNHTLKELSSGRARDNWEVRHYENAVHYLYTKRDIDIRWVLVPDNIVQLEVVK